MIQYNQADVTSSVMTWVRVGCGARARGAVLLNVPWGGQDAIDGLCVCGLHFCWVISITPGCTG